MEAEEILAQSGPIPSSVQSRINRKFGVQLQSYLWDMIPLTGPWYTASDSLDVAENTRQRVDREEQDVFKKAFKELILVLLSDIATLNNKVQTLETKVETLESTIESFDSRITALENA